MKIKLFILSFCILTFSCKKEKEKDKDSNTNFFACKIDGIEWVPECSTCFYAIKSLNKNSFAITATGKNGTSISLAVNQNQPIGSKTYLLTVYGKNNGVYSDELNLISYETDETHTGELNLFFDELNKTVSGEFYFNAVDNHKITDGRFRMPYN